MNYRVTALFAMAAATCVLAGCAGGTTGMPGGIAALPAAAQIRQTAPAVKPANGTPLLYVADSGSGTVKMYDYPGLAYANEITGLTQPLFLCLGKAGKVFVVDYATGGVSEYAHAATSPIKTLTGLSLPYQCAYFPTTGDLAVVANIESPSEHIGYVAVFHHASGTPTIYYDRSASLLSGVAYDSAGGLYVNGYAPDGASFYYAKLDAPERTFQAITLQGGTPGSPGPLFFDAFNNYMDIGDFSTQLYQTQGTQVVNTIGLGVPDSTSNGFSVPSLKRVIVADAFANQVLIYRYPHGGTAINSITSGLTMPWDAVVSK
jgi:hypothetical protein